MDTMPTPTSPDHPVKQDRPTPAEAIAAIGRGTFSAADLLGLSDLGRADAKTFATAWQGFSEPTRERVLRELTDLSENDVLLSFSRVFRHALTDPSAVLRQLAVAGLWEDEGTDLIQTFIGILNADPSSDVRAEAAVALGRFSQLAAIEELDEDDADAVQDALSKAARSSTQSPLVRRRAMESLAACADDADIAPLIEAALASDDTLTKASALFAMGRTNNRRWLGDIIGEFGSSDAELRFEAARASGEIGDIEAVSGLSMLLQDDDTDVRQAAITSLGKIGGPGAIRVLTSYAGKCPSGDRELVDDALAEANLMTDIMRDLP
jgi:HEAT repeat protein